MVDFDQVNISCDFSSNLFIVMPVTYVRNIVVIGFADLSGLSVSLKDRYFKKFCLILNANNWI